MTATANTQTATEVRCLGPCGGRKLTSPESIARGYSKACAAKIRAAAKTANLSAWTEPQIEDARQAIEDGAVVPSTRAGVFHVVSSDGTEVHRTAKHGCNCENGLKTRQPRPCWHRCAVTIVLASQASPDTKPTAPAPAPAPAAAPVVDWAEMDRITDALMTAA